MGIVKKGLIIDASVIDTPYVT